MTVFIYRYRNAEALKQKGLKDIPVLLKSGKATTGHTTFKEKRRSEKEIQNEIDAMEREMKSQDTKGQKGYERYQELQEKIRLLEGELLYNKNLEFVGEGEVNFGEGTVKDDG